MVKHALRSSCTRYFEFQVISHFLLIFIHSIFLVGHLVPKRVTFGILLAVYINPAKSGCACFDRSNFLTNTAEWIRMCVAKLRCLGDN
jgi:hypothetical protein